MDDLRGFRLCIVHYGERIPSAAGYAPIRYGRLAEDLTKRGAEVVRVSPSFNHATRDWSEPLPTSDEGTHVLIPTPRYDKSISVDRGKFLRAFIKGAAEYLGSHPPFDAVLAGVPPPGMLRAISRATAGQARIVADIRDIWPNALAVGSLSKFSGLARLGGHALSQELRYADEVLAVTPAMADWAPDAVNARVLPLGMGDRPLLQKPVPDKGIDVCFLSTHFHGYDFDPVFRGWEQFCEQTSNVGRFTAIGPNVPDGFDAVAASYGIDIEITGRLPQDQVHPLLSQFDVGIAPCTKEWAHSLGNKFFDYLSAGLYVLHSLEPDTGDVIDAIGQAQRVELTANSWKNAFASAHARRFELHAERAQRAEVATSHFGRLATTTSFLAALRPASGKPTP